MRILSFKWNTNYLICPILMGISFGIRYTFTSKINGINFLIFSLVMFLGQFSCFIFELIVKIRSKSSSRTQEVVNPKYEQIDPNALYTIRWDYLLLFCTSFLDLLSFSILGHVKTVGGQNESIDSLSFALRMSQTLFITGLTMLILKTQLYKHNILAIIIIFIGITSLVFMNMNSKSWIIFIVYILGYFLNALRIVIMKVLLDKWFYSTYQLLFIIGAIGIFLILLIMPFTLLIKSELFSFETIFVNSFQQLKTNPIFILYIIIVYLMGLLFNVSGTLTNHRLSPSHVGIGDTLAGLILIIIFKLNSIGSLIVSFLINLIILFACLIYTEIIVFDCWGLKRNTATEIFQRGLNESIETEVVENFRESGISLFGYETVERDNNILNNEDQQSNNDNDNNNNDDDNDNNNNNDDDE